MNDYFLKPVGVEKGRNLSSVVIKTLILIFIFCIFLAVIWKPLINEVDNGQGEILNPKNLIVNNVNVPKASSNLVIPCEYKLDNLSSFGVKY